MSLKRRRATGNMLVLIVCVTAFVVVPLLIAFCQYGPQFVFCGRAQNVVDAAGLLAAKELSRIVINDPYFGYVSLSDHPAVGRATRAQDGEPLPVIGINTLIGTLRQNALVADQLQNDKMFSLIDRDLAFLQTTINKLNCSLSQSLSANSSTSQDLDGKLVDPASDAKAFLEQNLPPTMKVDSIALTPGWLKEGSETTIEAPQPLRTARVGTLDTEEGKYQAFRNIPVGKRSFSFAGLGPQSHLVSTTKFQEADGAHICSVIKLECNLISTDASHTKTQYVACCQAFAAADQSPKGAMTVRFSGRPVPGILSWREFLSPGYFQDNKVTPYFVFGGDFPFDKDARMYISRMEPQSSTSEEFAEHLYYWLRSAHLRPRLDSIMAMINEPFSSGSNEVYSYELSDDGKISRKVHDGKGFTRAVTADGQSAVTADTRIRSGINAVVLFRDNVKFMGSKNGKHAGQPLAGYPLGGMDAWMDQSQLSLNFPKRSNKQNGLALDIEIGGTGESTARRDVLSMRQKTASRRI